ncbi:MAG TPA: nucleotidyl transferase AbiEii/AbiGii toxin family protein [Candidatus Paceibacterota bacterium]
MSDQILTVLKARLDGLYAYGELGAETSRNALKEELQFYVLNFIYHHPEYSKWVMYGGSALRIIHGLDRMSVDLDFEVAEVISKKFLEKLNVEIKGYFGNTYGVDDDFLTTSIRGERSLLLKFNVGEQLSFGHPSKQVHVKIDLNHFVAPKTVTERRPINHDQLSFVILTYNNGALMASKIAAIFLREERGRGKHVYDYKGRDIYDLLWYMKEKATPDFDYLNAKLKEKGKEIPDIRALFDKLTIDILNYEKMDDCLTDDLSFLFENPFQFDNWLKTWRESYLRLLNDYKIRTAAELERARIYHYIRIGLSFADEYHFEYWYHMKNGGIARIVWRLYEDWIIYGEGDLSVEIDKELEKKMEFSSNGSSSRSGSEENKLKRYATLFYNKTEEYLRKTNRVIVGDSIVTKVIRMTAENLNPKEQVLLNRSALESRELDDLLK